MYSAGLKNQFVWVRLSGIFYEAHGSGRTLKTMWYAEISNLRPWLSYMSCN
jgi:hypothetical protein